MYKFKKIIGIILVIVMVILCLTPFANADSKVIIQCEDDSLYNALCEKIGGAIGNNVLKTITITTDTLNGLTDLDLSGKNITNLKGIESLSALTTLNLSNNNIADLSKISDLKNLTYLNISNNNITDLEPISANPLTTLQAKNNKISSLSCLSTMENLNSIYVDSNLLTSLEGLESISTLTEIYASNNKITDISNVLGSGSLRVLNVSNNKIAKAETEIGESVLNQLNLNGNQIEDVTFLKNLKSLNNLDLSNNKIRTIPEFLANWINNNSIGVLKMNNQKISIVLQEKEMAFDKNSGYTNLLYWGYYFNEQNLATEVENGELDLSKLLFKFTDENKDGSITISDGVFSGSKIVVSYGGSKTETTADGKDDKNTDTTNNNDTTTNNNDTTTNTDTDTDTTNNTNTDNNNKNTVTTNVSDTTTKDDGTTANGKMPYTGITSKIVGIASLVTLLGAVVIYTYSQNKKNIKK